MKVFTLMLFLLAASASFAMDATDYTTGVTDFVTGITRVSTSNERFKQAQKIQDEIQEYHTSGVMGAYLTEQVDTLTAAGPEFSQEEAIDQLTDISGQILLRKPSND